MAIEITTAIIAGVSALSGVLISQVISITLSVLDKKHEKKILLRQKYEQLMFEFQDSLEYLLEVQNCKTFEDLQGCAYSQSAGRAVALTHLYFPSMKVTLSQYQQSLIHYYGSVVLMFNSQANATVGAQLQINSKGKKITEAFSNQRQTTLNLLIDNAKNFTNA